MPWRTSWEGTRKDSVLLLLRILAESVQLKGVEIVIFLMPAEVLCECSHRLLDAVCEAGGTEPGPTLPVPSSHSIHQCQNPYSPGEPT